MTGRYCIEGHTGAQIIQGNRNNGHKYHAFHTRKIRDIIYKSLNFCVWQNNYGCGVPIRDLYNGRLLKFKPIDDNRPTFFGNGYLEDAKTGERFTIREYQDKFEEKACQS